MGEFVFSLKRNAGGEPATIRVTDASITFSIPSDISDNELDAIKGIEALAIAMKRSVCVTREFEPSTT